MRGKGKGNGTEAADDRARLARLLRGRTRRARIERASFAQERLWFLERLNPGSPAYNQCRALRLRGPLDTTALQHALGELVGRHEALRTTFREHEGRLDQVIHPPAAVELPLEDLVHLEEGLAGARLLEMERDMARRPFDLQTGPPLRACLVRLRPEDHALLLAMHHIVTDGWSLDVLFRELGALYGEFSGRGKAGLKGPEWQWGRPA